MTASGYLARLIPEGQGRRPFAERLAAAHFGRTCDNIADGDRFAGGEAR